MRIGFRLLLTTVACGIAACTKQQAQSPLPDGLWDTHTHLTYWGEDTLDSLTKYGIVGVRDLGGDPVLLRKWRDEIARGVRRGPRIFTRDRTSTAHGQTAPTA